MEENEMSEKKYWYVSPCCYSMHGKEMNTMDFIKKDTVVIENTCHNCGKIFFATISIKTELVKGTNG